MRERGSVCGSDYQRNRTIMTHGKMRMGIWKPIQADRQTDRQTDRHTDSQTDRQTHRQTMNTKKQKVKDVERETL